MLCYSSSSEISAQQLAVAKQKNCVGLEFSQFHSVYHRWQKTTLGNKDPYEITATETMCKYWNFKSFWWMRAKRLTYVTGKAVPQVVWILSSVSVRGFLSCEVFCFVLGLFLFVCFQKQLEVNYPEVT